MSAIASWFSSLFARPPGAVVAEGPRLMSPLQSTVAPPGRFADCLAELLRQEGGYVDNPADPGGATNLGITLATLSDWRGRPVTKQEVRDLTKSEAGAIYRARYWNVVRADSLPPGLDLAVFDFAVNSGPARAVKTLQAVVGAAQDGAVGPITLAAIARASGTVKIITELSDARMRYLRSLPTWESFGRGWTRRVEEVKAAAVLAAG